MQGRTQEQIQHPGHGGIESNALGVAQAFDHRLLAAAADVTPGVAGFHAAAHQAGYHQVVIDHDEVVVPGQDGLSGCGQIIVGGGGVIAAVQLGVDQLQPVVLFHDHPGDKVIDGFAAFVAAAQLDAGAGFRPFGVGQIELDIGMQHPDAQQFAGLFLGDAAGCQISVIKRTQQLVHMAQLGDTQAFQRGDDLTGEQQHRQALVEGLGRLGGDDGCCLGKHSQIPAFLLRRAGG